MEKSGKWIVLVILALALSAGLFSWWHRWSATHQAAAYWGPQAATTIRDANVVVAARLTDFDPSQFQNLPLDDFSTEHSQTSIDASQARGLVHLKNALLDDRSFAWHQPVGGDEFVPRWLLRFSLSQGASASQVAVLLNDACTRCRFVANGKWSPIANCEPMSTGLRTLFADWFAPE